MSRIDFSELKESLLANSSFFLMKWLPGGRMDGKEYCIGSLRGEPGESLKINTTTGQWQDFASGDKGTDLINLYAAINNLGQGEAAKELITELGGEVTTPKPKKVTPKVEPIEINPIPDGQADPDFRHRKMGEPIAVWTYRNQHNQKLFHIARYKRDDGKKSFMPWLFSNGHWINKQPTDNRPIYGLEQFTDNNPKENVLIVEGEKCADAIRKIVGNVYKVVTWPGGSNALGKVDLSPLHGHKLLIWPDNDEAGVKAAGIIANKLMDHCPEIKVLAVNSTKKPNGWDAADAVQAGWDFAKFAAFAKPIVKNLTAERRALEVKKRAEEPVPQYQEPSAAPAKMNQYDLWSSLGLEVTGRGTPINNVDNCYRFLQNYENVKDILWYDEFHRNYFIHWPDEEVRPLQEEDEVRILIMAQRECRFSNLSLDKIRSAVKLYARENIKNDAKDWVETLKWDGVNRVTSCFVDYFGAQDNEYTNQVSQNFWVSLAARIMRPGSKVDNMVILEGAQGARKSTSLSIIGGKWYAEIGEQMGSKDFYLKLQGNLIVEIAELNSFNKSEVNTIKKVITETIDAFRPPYGRTTERFPRQCVFVGSTNDDDYLRDATGARRFWPIKCTKINTEELEADREQLFAEAINLFKQGVSWYEVNDKMAALEQDKRYREDPWTEYILDYLLGKEQVTVRDLLESAIKLDIDRIDQRAQNRVSDILKKNNWTKGNRERIGNQRKQMWVDKDTLQGELYG